MDCSKSMAQATVSLGPASGSRVLGSESDVKRCGEPMVAALLTIAFLFNQHTASYVRALQFMSLARGNYHVALIEERWGTHVPKTTAYKAYRCQLCMQVRSAHHIPSGTNIQVLGRLGMLH